MLTPGQIITLDIERPVAGGRMLARHDGQVVLVEGAIPGERVSACVGSVDKSLAQAEVVDLLTALRASSGANLGEVVDPLVTELDAARAGAKGLRGDARRQLLERLQALDARLLTATRERVDAATLAGLATEADAELAPFRDRMPAEAYGRAHTAWLDRLIRDRFSLPVIAFE